MPSVTANLSAQVPGGSVTLTPTDFGTLESATFPNGAVVPINANVLVMPPISEFDAGKSQADTPPNTDLTLVISDGVQTANLIMQVSFPTELGPIVAPNRAAWLAAGDPFPVDSIHMAGTQDGELVVLDLVYGSMTTMDPSGVGEFSQPSVAFIQRQWNGSAWASRRVDVGPHVDHEITILPPTGWSYVDITSVTPASAMVGGAVLKVGDQLSYPDPLTVNADGTYSGTLPVTGELLRDGVRRSVTIEDALAGELAVDVGLGVSFAAQVQRTAALAFPMSAEIVPIARANRYASVALAAGAYLISDGSAGKSGSLVVAAGAGLSAVSAASKSGAVGFDISQQILFGAQNLADDANFSAAPAVGVAFDAEVIPAASGAADLPSARTHVF